MDTIETKNLSEPPSSGGTPDIRRIVTIHAEASQHREELLEEARQLLREGRIREARRLMKTAEELRSQLKALETQMSAQRVVLIGTRLST